MYSLSPAPTESTSENSGIFYLLLILLLTIMMGGGFPAVFILLSRNTGWATWVLLWLVMIILARSIPVPRLLLPVASLLIWMLGYICWGCLAATYPIAGEGFRLAFRFGSCAMAMAIVTSHPRRWVTFATAAQWALVGNLLIMVFVQFNPQYQRLPIFNPISIDLEGDRFAGLWGNANQAALITLLILVLSHWAKRWVARLGQLSGCIILYLTASRTGVLIATALLLLHVVFGSSWKARFKILLASALLLVSGGYYLSYTGAKPLSFLQDSQTIARVLDLSESQARRAGSGSRVDLLKSWMPFVAKEPWYGYGLFAMNGAEIQEPGIRRWFPEQGTHNIYLGILIDVGLPGLLTFLMVVGWQLVRIYQFPLEPSNRRMMFALCFITLVFALTNHNMISDYPGWLAFLLIFLLPSSWAMRGSNVDETENLSW